jgi:hypothetical protein
MSARASLAAFLLLASPALADEQICDFEHQSRRIPRSDRHLARAGGAGFQLP